ncbi:MAG: T9SS type A sorting domain-containing protein [Prevotella sp.]|jgi:hypothetical protein|nr:T9SS type A sorting domain-containing protein [Prevotella sp.]
MRAKIFTLMAAMALFTNAMAQESNVWFDIDFSTDEWIDGISAALQDSGKTIGNDTLRTIPAGTAVDMGIETPITVNGFTFNSPVYREPTTFTSVCGRTFGYAVRFRNNQNDMSYIEFPIVDNAGKITVYVANGNGTNASTIDLGRKEVAGEEGRGINDPYGEWKPAYPVKQWDVPGNGEYVDGEGNAAKDLELTYEINTSEQTALRLCRKKGQFMKVYRIVLEKYTGSGVSSSFGEKMSLSVSGKTLLLPKVTNAKMSVYNLAGKPVLNTAVTSDKVALNLPADVYIAKLVAGQGELTQKIILK